MSAGTLALTLLSFVVSTAIGYFTVALLWPPVRSVLVFVFAPVTGLALCSILFVALRRPMFTIETALLLILGTLWFRRNRPQFASLLNAAAWRPSVLAVFLAAVVGFSISALGLQLSRAPHGDWDGMAIWNSHARFLYRDGPGWIHDIQNTFHADYPLLTPASTARIWRYTGSEYPEAGGFIDITFAITGILMLTLALAEMRDGMLAAIAGLTLLATPFYLSAGVGQYADVPISIYFLASIVLLCLHDQLQPGKPGLLILSGFMAGCAGWTKNEGLLFMGAACAVLLLPAIARPRQALRRLAPFAAGLLLPLIAIVVFKIRVGVPNDIFANRQFAEVIGRLYSLVRYATILEDLRHHFWDFGDWRVHPVIPFLIWLALRGIDRKVPEGWAWLSSTAILAMVGLGYFMIYIITPMDLQWHLDSSLPRLLLQLWPSSLFLLALLSRPRLKTRLPASL